MSRQGDDESRKQQIRAAAVRCFVRRGFSATRLLDIARQAGLSKGGVYFYYNTIEALFEVVLDAQRAQIEARWAFTPGGDGPADVTLERLVIAHLRTIEDDPDDTRLHHLLVSMAPQEGPFRDKLVDGTRILRDLYAQVIDRGVREGVFNDGEADHLADVVLAMVQGLAAQTALHPEGRLLVRPEAAAATVLSMLAPRDASVSVPAGLEAPATRPALQS
ncbi:MAG: TetR/AcrR family transcriptional regulator [Myxococcota bacterium]